MSNVSNWREKLDAEIEKYQRQDARKKGLRLKDLLDDDVLDDLVTAMDAVIAEREEIKDKDFKVIEVKDHWWIIDTSKAEFDTNCPGELMDEVYHWKDVAPALLKAKKLVARNVMAGFGFDKVPFMKAATERAAEIADHYAKEMTDTAKAFRAEAATKPEQMKNAEICEKTSWVIREVAHGIRNLK